MRAPFLAAFALALLAFASMSWALNASLVYANGTPVSLSYDPASQSYADLGPNPNAFLRLCDSGSLDGKYAGLLYKVGDSYKQVSTPLGGGFGDLMLVSTSTACVDLDVQISSFRAFYPAWPVAVISDDPFISSGDTFLNLSNSTGWMNGSYIVTKSESGSNVTINVTGVRSQNGTGITVNRSYLVIGIRNSSGGIMDSNITSPGVPINLSRGSYTGLFDIIINGIPTPPTCDDGTLPGNCSVTEPLYCNSYGALVDNCTACGCPPGRPLCTASGSCVGGGGGGGGGGCVIDDQCPDTHYCFNTVCTLVSCPCGNVSNHKCHPYACCADSDCGPGKVCINHTCVVVPERCVNDSECPPGFICVNGECKRAECEKDGDCPEGMVCRDGRCKPCERNEDCPEGMVCRDGRCRPCESSEDCPEGLVCVDGRCRPCGRNEDCPEGKVCIDGKCRKECERNEDCPAELVCRNGRCVSAPPECNTDAECPAGKFCVSGHCRAKLMVGAPQTVEINSQLNITVFYSDGTPAANAEVEIIFPSGRVVNAVADSEGKLSIYPDELGEARITARKGVDVAKGKTLILPIRFIATIGGFTIKCSDAWIFIVLIAALSSLLAWWLIRSRLKGEKEKTKRRVMLWGGWLLVSMALFLLPLFASLLIDSCVLVLFMPLEVLFILLIEILFIIYDAVRGMLRTGEAEVKKKEEKPAGEAGKPKEGAKAKKKE